MIDFCVLGSGIAGSTVANLLSKKYSVHVFDKARGPGGRSSNKRFKKNLSFDHGVQYISPKSKPFIKYIQKLYKKKILKSWDDDHLDFTFEKKLFSTKYIGRKANNDLVKFNLKNIKQSFASPIEKINFKKYFWEITLKDKSKYQFKSLIITCPFPQLKKLAKKYLDKKILKLKVQMQPNITVMVAFKNQECACFGFKLSTDVPSKTHSKRVEMKVATIVCNTSPIDCSDVTVSVVVRKDLLVFPIVNKPRVTLRCYFSAN